MNNEALPKRESFRQTLRTYPRNRWHRIAAETGYDAAAWLGGLIAASWITRDLAGTGFAIWRAALAVCLIQPGSGLLAGLYVGRHQRGSFDEVLGVSLGAAGTALSLGAIGALLVPGQWAPLATAGGAAVFALAAMLAARYVLFAVRRRSRVSASPTVKIIIFGAGGAGVTFSDIGHIMVEDLSYPFRAMGICQRMTGERELQTRKPKP